MRAGVRAGLGNRGEIDSMDLVVNIYRLIGGNRFLGWWVLDWWAIGVAIKALNELNVFTV